MFEIEYLKEFSHTRHMGYHGGPYITDEAVLNTGGTIPGEQNTPPDGQPGLWCQWAPTDDGAALEWDGGEKFYDSEEWMRYLIDTFLSDSAALRKEIAWGHPRVEGRYYADQFGAFTFDHVLNGVIEAQGEDVSDHWWLIVHDNTVKVATIGDVIGDATKVIKGFLDQPTVTTVTEETEITLRGRGPIPAGLFDMAAGAAERETTREELLANGGVEHGGITFVSAEARDEFYAMLAAEETDEDRRAKDTINRIRARHGLDADTIAAVQEGVAEAERGETKDLGSFAAYAEEIYEQPPVASMTPEEIAALGDGMAYTDMSDDPATIKALDDADAANPFADDYEAVMRAEAAAALDDGPSYADMVNAPIPEAVAHEIGRQIKSGDYPRFTRTTIHKTDRDGIATDVHESRPVRTTTETKTSVYGDGTMLRSIHVTTEPADPGGGDATPGRFGFIECANIEDSLWPDDEDNAEPNPDPMFYIWSNRHQLYWGPNRRGYVTDPSQAGQYTAAEASEIVANSMRGINLGYNHNIPDSIMLPVGA